MTRVVVSALHTFLGASIVLGGLSLFVQAELNATWELGFYRQITLLTGAILATSIVMLGLAVIELGAAFGYALGRRWGAWGLLLVSVFLTAAAPSPLSWLVAIAAGAILVELWVNRPRPDDEGWEGGDR